MRRHAGERASLPVRLVRTLLRGLGAPEHAIGDLEEEHRRRLGTGAGDRAHGELRTTVWYVAEGLSLAGALLLERIAGASTDFEGNPRERRGDMGAGMGKDLVTRLRGLARRPAGTAALVGTIAVAVGASTAVFAVVSATWLRPLPYDDADRLVRVYSAYGSPATHTAVAPATLRDLVEQDAVLEAVGAWSEAETVHLGGDGEPLRLTAPRASAALFEMTGLPPALGRLLEPEDEVPGRDDVVVLAHGFWVDRFGRDPAVLGRRLVLDGRTYEVAGVAHPEMALPADADLWRPLALGAEWFEPARRGWEFLSVVGRLPPGVDAVEATRRLTDRYAEVAPDRAGGLEQGVAAVPFRDDLVGPAGAVVLHLFGAVGLLLAMAVVNVTAVLLARSEVRLRELATRRALGAGAGPILRIIVMEATVLAVTGSGIGLLLAATSLQAVARLHPTPSSLVGDPSLDLRVLVFVAAVVGAAILAFAAGPAVRALRIDPAGILGAGGRGGSGSRGAGRTRRALVAGQVAIAIVLLAGLALAGRGLRALVAADPGFEPRGVLSLTLELPAAPEDAEAGASVYRALEERLRALPGVTAVGFTNGLPLEGTVWSASFELVDPDPQVADLEPGANMRAVSPAYFEAMGMRLVAGRGLAGTDRAGAGPPVVVVDETLARRYWPSGSPVGRRVLAGALSAEPATVVGVVADVPDQGLHRPGSGHLYFPLLQRPLRRATAVLRTSADPAALAPAARQAIRDVDPRVPVFDVRTLEDRLSAELSGPRLTVALLSTFAVVALALAGLGVYGVLAQTVALRRREIGTRIALGARPGQVTRAVVAEGVAMWLVGALVGGTGAAWAAGSLGRLLPSAAPPDLVAVIAAATVLGVVAVGAALVPAWRAARLDPAEALRREG